LSNSLQVLILMGSQNDAPIMQGAVDVLKELGISVEMTVASAHRSPERVMRLLGEAETRGVSVFIVGAGAAAHLGGVVAAHVTKPVIGVPIASSALNGLDASARPVRRMPVCSPRRFSRWETKVLRIESRSTNEASPRKLKRLPGS